MRKLLLVAAIASSLVACKRKKPEEALMPAPPPPPATGSGSAAAPKPVAADDLAKRYEECWGFYNDSKWDDFKSCYATDAVSEHPGQRELTITGNAAIVDGVKAGKAALPDAKGQTELVLVSGHTVVGVSLLTGTTPDKAKVGVMMPQVIEFDDAGKAKRQADYEDNATVVGQMKPDPKRPVRAPIDKLPMVKEVAIAKNDDKEKANLDTANKAMAAFDAHDAKAFGALLADDVVWSEQPDPKDWTKTETVTNAGAFWKAFGDVKLTADKQYAAGDYVATVGTLEGTNDGDMPAMHLKKTGKHVQLPFLMIQKLDGGKIKSSWLFQQEDAFEQQLGLRVTTPASASK